jgi:tRNA (cytidine32/guanosine34-2'-O)-methyltransferase
MRAHTHAFVHELICEKDTSLLYAQMKIFFKFVSIEKPSSSRASSLESFILCQHFDPPAGYIAQMVDPMLSLAEQQLITSTPNQILLPFLATGSLVPLAQ